jgi:hypothetical protein
MDTWSDPTPMATPEQFKAALLAVRDRIGISPKDLAMLRAHCRAPNHTTTTTQLAKEIGYQHYAPAGLLYGKLAHEVCDALRYKLPPTPNGEPHWWRTLAYGDNNIPHTDDGHYKWIMRPELVLALQALKWA